MTPTSAPHGQRHQGVSASASSQRGQGRQPGDQQASGSAGGPRQAPFVDPDQPVYVISVAAELAGMHAQTLRQYDRLGLVTPERTRGGGRRYSARDIESLRQIQELSSDGVSLAGIQRIMELQGQVSQLEQRLARMIDEVQQYRDAIQAHTGGRVFAAGRDGIVALRPGERPQGRTPGSSLVLYRPRGR